MSPLLTNRTRERRAIVKLLAPATVFAAIATVGATNTPAGPKAFPGRVGKLVFVKLNPTARASDLYLVSPSGKNGIRLTHSALAERFPVWSPNGRLIAFERQRGGATGPGSAAVFVMTAEGRHIRRITRWIRGLLLEPTWSPDGRQLAYVRPVGSEDSGDIFVVDSRSHKTTNLTRTPNEDESSPAWSPDGRQIAYESDGTSVNGALHLYVMRADGSARRRLTRGRDIGTSAPDWSPDGSRLLFDHGPGGSWIAVIKADGTGEKLLVNTDGSVGPSPSWSPDGKRIVFAATRPAGRISQLYVMKANGSGIRRVTHSRDWRVVEPDWQPR